MNLRPIGLTSLMFLGVLANAQYVQTNLVSDGSLPANVVDADLGNPWGLAASPTSPIWIADNSTNLSTLYQTSGTKIGLTVSVGGGPTGIVYNSAGGFQIGGKNASFIFDSLDGTISGWNGGTSSTVLFDQSGSGASYTGLGVLGQNIYAANAASGNVDVFNGTTGFVKSFTDSSLNGSGYTPFGIQAIGSDLYVTFAGAGMGGYVDEFDGNGNMIRRVVSQGALDCPWGIALAPSNFGQFSNDLLIGNNDTAGWINAYNVTTGAFVGTMEEHGTAISNDGLWGMEFGNGGASGAANVLYFTAGPNDTGGLYGSLATPEPKEFLPLLGGVLLFARRRRR